MAERPVTFNLRTPGEGVANGSGHPLPGRDPPDAHDVLTFSRALQDDRTPTSGSHPSSGSTARADSAPLPSPFELFRTAASAADHATSTAEPVPALVPALTGLVDKLMVGDGQDGRRMARLELDDSVMPGVSVVIQEDAGAWVAEFSCTNPESFTRLAQPAQSMARQLAEALSQDAVWRVVPDGLDPHGSWRVAGPISAPDGGVEAFASAPVGARESRNPLGGVRS